MSKNKQKLELTWIGKDREVNLEPRILVEVPEKSYGDNDTENMLIHGDNLLALKALEQDFAGKIKCIYIDPPYNTGSAFEHYDDNVEHSTWLTLMRERLTILKNLLTEDGCIFVQIDDNEQAYLKVMMDEIFGRQNFVNCIAVKMSEASGVKMAHTDKRLPKLKEYILLFKKNVMPTLKPDLVPVEKWNDEYKHILVNISDEEIFKLKNIIKKESASQEDVLVCEKILETAKIESLTSFFEMNKISKNEQNEWKFKNAYRIIQAVGSSSVCRLAKSQCRKNQEVAAVLSSTGLVYLYKENFDRNSKQPRVQIIFADENLLQNPGDFWTDIKTTGAVAQEGGVLFENSKKPELLIKKIITSVTDKGDLVLDSFLGSGTTAAVAHKMGRKWIGIELGDHCYTHCEPRLQKVVDGVDQGGISKAVNWQGGGGYRFYELAPSLLKKDEFDNWIIEPKYDAEMLAEAMAKHEGYKFSPDETNVYKQGKSTEKDFIFTTTQFISLDLLNKIATQINEDESLLICATYFEEGIYNKFSNITIKKIPQILLDRCEFGKLEYNLNIIEESQPEDFEDEEILEDEE